MSQIWPIGSLLRNRYQIQADMGPGMQGVSCLARDLKTDRLVVVWPIAPHLAHNEYELLTIKRHFSQLQQLDHPSIARAYSFEQDPATDIWFYVMEYVVGINLGAWRMHREQGRITWPEAVNICQSIAEALDFAHHFLLHRNLRPQNVIVMPDLKIKLTGFDLLSPVVSRMMRAEYLKTHREHAFAIHNYMAPELFFDFIPPGATVDHYSLAVLFYELVTGQLPFGATNTRELMHAVCNVMPQEVDFLDGPCNQALQQAMAKDPGLRFHAALDFVQAIKPSPPSRLPKRWFFSSSALLATCGIAWFVVTTPPQSAALFLRTQVLPSLVNALPVVAQSSLSEVIRPVAYQPHAAVQWAARSIPPVTPPPVTMPDLLLLRVNSRPSGATLFLDGQRMGTTPFSMAAVKPGMHKVRMEKAQYAPVEVELELTKDTIVDLSLESLAAAPAETDPLRTDLRPEPAALLPQEQPEPTQPASQKTEKTGEAQEKNQAKIATLLKLAKRYFQEDRLTRPRESHALAVYRQILALAPDHPEARQGIQEIIARLLLLAQEDLDGWRLIRPLEKNAMDKYRNILAIDADHAQAQAGLEAVVDRLLSLAQRFADNPEKSLDYLRQAEEVLPGLPRIAEMRVSLFPKSARNREVYGHPVREEQEMVTSGY